MSIACPDCAARQRIPALPAGGVAVCLRCGRTLDRAGPWGLRAGLAFSLSTLMLLGAANGLPLMRATLQGISRDVYLVDGVRGLWQEAWPVLAVMFAAFAIVLPLIRNLLICVVLTCLRWGGRPAWLGPMYRYAEGLRFWAMPEVVVIAGFVLYMRTAAQLEAEVAWGGWCLIGAAVLSLSVPRVVGSQEVWRAISAGPPMPEDQPATSCEACNLVLPMTREGRRCPRCRRRVHVRKPNAMHRTAALVVAGFILYFPSYYFPMSYTVRPDGVRYHTIFAGIGRLVEEDFLYLAVILFIASVGIPFLKLVGLTWLLVRVRHPSSRHLVLRTRLHRFIHGIGRWSNTDPFIVAVMAPLMSFVGVADVHVGRAALPFALVVTLTMLASRSFDSRLMWDAAEQQP